MRYFIVSDIHNHYSILKEVLKNKGFDENNKDHKLIVCGDAFVRGPEGGKTFEYLQRLYNLGKLVFIFGNHDLHLLKDIKYKTLSKSNKETVIDILKYYKKDYIGLNDKELCELIKELGLVSFIENYSIPYFETNKYIFVHGFIPTKNKKYIKNWRESSLETFKGATLSDSMSLVLKHGIKEEGKTIVTGHFSTARGHMMKNATKEDWDNKIYKDIDIRKVDKSYIEPFYTDGLILIDGSVYKTGIINCLIIDD